jgi:hypothetical protein
MASGRRWPFLFLFFAASLVPACGDDRPDKEIQQAQAAIASAKAAGANDYAHDEFVGAQDALKRAQDALTQQDYRLALTSAIDSRERAQSATTLAVDQKTIAKSAAERTLAGTLNALAEAKAKVQTAQAARVPARILKEPLKVIDDADALVQKAGAAFQREEYLSIKTILEDQIGRLSRATRDLSPRADAPPRRRR